VLSCPIFTGERRTAIQAEDIRSGESRLLATRSDEPSLWSKHWKFDPEALDWGSQVLWDQLF